MNGIYNKSVYIGNPNQTRHLGDHHRIIEILEPKRHTLLNLLKGVDDATNLPVILFGGGFNRHLYMYITRKA